MKREILFRGKRIDNGQWHLGSLVEQGDDYFVDECHGRIYNGNTDEAFNGLIVDSKTVGQYAGFKDKNGKRIFEEDIIDNGTLWVVRFNKGCFCADMINATALSNDTLLALRVIKDPFVIGNLHDNPELLTPQTK